MPGYSTAFRNALMDLHTSTIGNVATLSIYDGTRPVTGGAATTLLAQFTLGTPFAPAAVGGSLSPTLPAATTGLANSTATWGRITDSTTAFVADLSAGTSGTEILLNTAAISVGLNISVISWTISDGNP